MHQPSPKPADAYPRGGSLQPASNGDVFYEAKVLSAEQEDGEWEYLIHYQGWNKKWDEWLPADRLLKDTEDARTAEVRRAQMRSGVQTLELPVLVPLGKRTRVSV